MHSCTLKSKLLFELLLVLQPLLPLLLLELGLPPLYVKLLPLSAPFVVENEFWNFPVESPLDDVDAMPPYKSTRIVVFVGVVSCGNNDSVAIADDFDVGSFAFKLPFFSCDEFVRLANCFWLATTPCRLSLFSDRSPLFRGFDADVSNLGCCLVIEDDGAGDDGGVPLSTFTVSNKL